MNLPQVAPVTCAFSAFSCVLGAYYLLMPMREEAGLALGVDTLPALFTLSLLATLLAAPAVAAMLSRAVRGQGHKRLFGLLAGGGRLQEG